MVFESLLKMSQRELFLAVVDDLRRITQCRELGPNRSLSDGKSSPDVIGGRKTQFAVELTKGIEFIPVALGAGEEQPQLLAGEEELLDFIRHPDAKGPTTSCCSGAAITAKDTRRTNCSVELVQAIVPAQESIFDQVANGFAVWTRSEF